MLAFLLASPSTALRPPTIAPLDPCLGHETSAKAEAPFVEKVWRLILWQRGKPKLTTVRAYRDKLRCAGPGNRKALKRRWRLSRRTFFKYRHKMLYDWCSPHPHPEGNGCWVIPAWCVSNESGERWTAHNPTSPARGPYQLLSHGEPWPVTTRAQALEHHRIAAALYAAGGLGPWVAC